MLEACLLSLAVLASAPAQDPPTTPPEGRASASGGRASKKDAADTTVVIGDTESVEDIDALRKRSVVPLTGITREEFTAQPKNSRLGDVVDRLPSVNSPNGLPGENKDTGARGMSHQFTRFQFDGVQLPAIGNQREFRLNRLSPISVGSVILLRSPSAEYESDGFGGRFVVTRRRIPEDAFFEVRAGAGVQYEPEREVYGHLADFAFGVGQRVNERFGFTLFGDYNVWPQQRLSNTRVVDAADRSMLLEDDTEIEDKYWQNASLMGDFALFYDGGELHFKPYLMELVEHRESARTELFTGDDDEYEPRTEDKPRRMIGMGIDHEHAVSDTLDLHWHLGRYHAQEEFDRDTDLFVDDGTGFVLDRTDVIDRTTVDEFTLVNVDLTRTFEDDGPFREAKLGLMLRPREFREDDHTFRLDPVGAVSSDSTEHFSVEETYYALYGQAEMDLGGGVELLPGVRYEHVELDNESFDPDGSNANSGSTDDVLPSLHAVKHLDDRFDLRASVSRGITRPRYSDLSSIRSEGSSSITVGNPDVEPMRAWSYDLGVDYIDGDLLLAVTGFYKDVEGLIEAVDTGTDVGGKDLLQYSNVGDGHVVGVELEQRWVAARGERSRWTLWANQTFLDSEATDADGAKRPFNRTPEVLANFGVTYDHLPTGLSGALNLKYQGGYDNHRAQGNEETLETWYADLKLGKQLAEGARVTLEVLNLLDTQKEQVHDYTTTYDDSYSSLGRTLRFGLEVSF